MVRTQIQLTEQQAAKARALAIARGVSMAEVIRTALDEELLRSSDTKARARAASVIGCVSSGLGDLSVNHDDYVADAFQE